LRVNRLPTATCRRPPDTLRRRGSRRRRNYEQLTNH
jgi:hypothetical protein